MKRKTISVLVVVLFLLAVAAAGCGAQKRDAGNAYPSEAAPGFQEDGYLRGDIQEEKSMAPPVGEGSFGGAEQKIIRTADYSLEVTDLDKVQAELRALVNRHNGIIASSHQGGRQGDTRYAYYTVRLPVAGYEAFLAGLEELGTVTGRSENASDVTMQYIDLEARIRNAERQEERLLSILDRAETVEDVLRVEQELARVRERLESMVAEFRYLRDRVDYCTVNISFTETPVAGTAITGTGLKGVWQRGWRALVRSVNGMLLGLGNLVVFFFAALPYLLALLPVVVLAVYLKKRFLGGGFRSPRE